MSEVIDGYQDYLLAGGAPPDSTVRDRISVLRRLDKELPDGIEWAKTTQLVRWLANGRHRCTGRAWSVGTRRTYRNHILAFFTYACELGLLDGNPALRLPQVTLPRTRARPISDDQLATLLAAPEPIRTAAYLAAYAGLRRAEIANCRREHITPAELLVPRGKGGSPGVVPTHPALWEHIHSRDAGPLVVDRRGPFDAIRLGNKVIHWCNDHGLPRVGLHRLRHWYGTTLQRQGGDIRVTQECLRHASITSTQIYTLVTDQQRRAAVSLLPVQRTLEPAATRLERRDTL
ncbi:MAG TPA: tyrosine-type recombinase/integrase [Thermopolyspora sp.]|jgi:Site-specific recombinase XerD